MPVSQAKPPGGSSVRPSLMSSRPVLECAWTGWRRAAEAIAEGDDSRTGAPSARRAGGNPESYRPGSFAPISRLSRRISVSRASSTGSMTFIAACTAVSGSPEMP